MNSGELLELWRSDVNDSAAPYLWSDAEAYAYMNDAYRQFIRNTGGVPDISSAVTRVPVVAGEKYATVSPLILRFMGARLASTGRPVEIVNATDLPRMSAPDYGQLRDLSRLDSPGPIHSMIVGQERVQAGGTVQWVQVPVVDDVVELTVFRLPLDTIADGDEFFEFPDIGAEHVEHLAIHMKARAYGKQDAETFDRGRRDAYKAEFAEYCRAAVAEWNRYKHKTRVVQYGGL